MKRWLSVLLVVLLLGTLVPTAHAATLPAPTPPFWDVIGTDVQQSVGYLHAAGLVSGTTETTFAPLAPVTRAQMAALVVRALGKQGEAASSSANFRDVPSSHWASSVIAKAVELGIVRGISSTEFAPDAPVTHPQAITMLLRALDLERSLVGEYPVAHFLKARELGWLEGIPFDLAGLTTRGDMAKMLVKAVFITPAASGQTLSASVVRRAAALEIRATAPYLTTGSNQLTALGADWFGNTFAVSGVVWGGTRAGYTVGGDGNVNVTTADSVTVTARVGTLAAERTFDVLSSIAISGGNEGIRTGGTVALKAEGKTPAGRTVALRPNWRVVSGQGSVSADGVLTATGSGTIRVEATYGSLRAEVSVASASSISVEPANPVLAIGQSQKLTAKVLDNTGAAIAMPVTWQVTSGSGTITADGVLTAGSSGPIKVRATAGGLSTETTVQLVYTLDISPSPASVAKGGTVQFSVKGRTLDGTVVPVDAKWSLTGSVGIMGTNGQMIGTNPGTGQVVAEYFGVSASAPVTVAGEAAAIKLEASRNSLPANGSSKVTLTATVVDSRGVPAQGSVQNVTFALSSGNLGSLSETTVAMVEGKAQVTFTPSEQAGQVIVIASAPGTQLASGSTTLTTVVPAIARIKLEAYPSTLAADNVSQTTITATLEDTEGHPIKNMTGGNIGITLSTSAATTGILGTNTLVIAGGASSATTFFRATAAVGATTITGAANYSVTPVTVSTVIVGPAAKLHIVPPSDNTRADGTTLKQIRVEIRDANGYVRTGDFGTVLQLTATSGNTVLTQTASTMGGIATFTLTSTVAGTYSVKATSTNATVAAAEASTTWVPGPAHRVDLSVEPSTSIAADTVTVVRLRAKIVDQYGNTVTNAAKPVTFSKTSNQNATAVVNSQTVTPVNGEAVLETKSTAFAGTDVFVASAEGLNSSSSVSVTSRITGNAFKLRVRAISPGTVTAGQSFTVQVEVLDSLDQLVTGSNGRQIGLLVSSPTATVSGSQLTQGGLATFTITDTKAGTITVTATSAGLVADNVGRSVTVVAGTVSTIRLEASPTGIAADNVSYTTISSVATDSYGNVVPWTTGIQLSIDNTTSGRLMSTFLYSGSQVTLVSTTVPGTINVTGTGAGLTVTPIQVKTHVPAAPARVEIEAVPSARVSDPYVTPTTFRARVLDVNGNLATGVNTGALMSAIGVTISGSGGTNTTRITASSNSGLGTFSPNGITTGSGFVTNGIATFQVTNTRAESVFLTPIAFYNGQPLPVVGASFRTIPDVASTIQVSPTNLVLSAQSMIPTTIQASVVDRFGNIISTENDTLTFTPNNTTHLTFPETLAIATVNGTASLTVTSKISASGGNTLLTISSSRTGLSHVATIATDLPPATPTVQATNLAGNSSIVNVGDGVMRVQVTASSRQSVQTVFVYVNGQLKSAFSDTAATTPAGSLGIGQVSWTGYIRTSDFNPGSNSVTVILANGLGLSPVSTPTNITVQ